MCVCVLGLWVFVFLLESAAAFHCTSATAAASELMLDMIVGIDCMCVRMCVFMLGW